MAWQSGAGANGGNAVPGPESSGVQAYTLQGRDHTHRMLPVNSRHVQVLCDFCRQNGIVTSETGMPGRLNEKR